MKTNHAIRISITIEGARGVGKTTLHKALSHAVAALGGEIERGGSGFHVTEFGLPAETISYKVPQGTELPDLNPPGVPEE